MSNSIPMSPIVESFPSTENPVIGEKDEDDMEIVAEFLDMDNNSPR